MCNDMFPGKFKILSYILSVVEYKNVKNNII